MVEFTRLMPPCPSQALAPVAVLVVPSLHAIFPDCACATAGIAAARRAAAAVRERKRDTDMGPSEGVAKLTRSDSSSSPEGQVRGVTFGRDSSPSRRTRRRSGALRRADPRFAIAG